MSIRTASWRFLIMPWDPAWRIWLVTALMLAIGLAGYPSAYLAAIGLTIGQTLFLLARGHGATSSPIQTRVAYTLLLIVCFVPGLRWLYWLPAAGTFALVICGYCLMARLLALLPWNRTERITPELLRRTFLTPPAFANTAGGERAQGCPGGVCSIEAQLGGRRQAARNA